MDLHFLSDNKWSRSTGCEIETITNKTLGTTVHKIKTSGIIEQYKPFNEYPQILSDLINFIRAPIDLHNHQSRALYMERASNKVEKETERLEARLLDEYKKFVEKYGLLGLQHSRIIGTSRVVTKDGEDYFYATTQSLTIAEGYTQLMRKMAAQKDGSNSIRISDEREREDGAHYVDGALPEEGGTVTIEEWNRSCGGLRPPDYFETLDQLMSNAMLWNIINHVESKDPNKTFAFSTPGVTVQNKNGKPSYSWRFNSLIQALSIMYAESISGNYDLMVRPCQKCGRSFTTKDANKKFCTTDCASAARQKRYRDKKINNGYG